MDTDAFYSSIKIICALSLLTMPIAGLRYFFRGSFALEWRRYLTNKLLRSYIGTGQAYDRLKFHEGLIDNPDQRIIEDTGNFIDSLTFVMASLLQALCVIFSRSGMLLAISPELFAFVVVYSLIVNVVIFLAFGRRMVNLMRKAFAQEATVRFGLVRVRENAEPIPCYHGAEFEKGRCKGAFNALTVTLYSKLRLHAVFVAMHHAVGLFMKQVPYVIVAGKYLAGVMDFGAIWHRPSTPPTSASRSGAR